MKLFIGHLSLAIVFGVSAFVYSFFVNQDWVQAGYITGYQSIAIAACFGFNKWVWNKE